MANTADMKKKLQAGTQRLTQMTTAAIGTISDALNKKDPQKSKRRRQTIFKGNFVPFPIFSHS